MARDIKLSSVVVNVQANALGAEANDGYLRIYNGTKPASANVAVTDQRLLAELRLSNPAFGAAVNGVMTTTSIMPDDHSTGDGSPATWCRFFKADGWTVLFDGTVGVGSNFDIDINNVNIQENAVVSISSYTHTVPKS